MAPDKPCPLMAPVMMVGPVNPLTLFLMNVALALKLTSAFSVLSKVVAKAISTPLFTILPSRLNQ